MVNTKNGFSLVEVLIAVAVLGGLSVAGMSLIKTQTKATVKNAMDSEVNLITNEIVGILSDPAKCMATLGSRNAISTAPGVINRINNISGDRYYTVTHPSAPPNGYGNENINIASYTLKSDAVELAKKNSTLIINFERKKILTNATSSPSLPKSINLYVEVDASNNITNCRSLSTHSAEIWSRGNGNNIFYSIGNVGIGTNAPQTSLDVAGAIRTANFTTGSACSPQGAMGFDYAADTPVYCSLSGWKPMGGGSATNEFMCIRYVLHFGGDGRAESVAPFKSPTDVSGFYSAGHSRNVAPSGWYGTQIACTPL